MRAQANWKRGIALAWAIVVGGSLAKAEALISQTTAARNGLTRAWYAQAGSQHATGELAHVNYVQGLLLVQTSRSMITAFDAETGRTIWRTQVGPPNHQSSEPAASADHVVVVNGSILYVLDRATGHLQWQRQLGGAPGAGPGASSTHAFVPMVSGVMEGYDLKTGNKGRPWVYKSWGRLLISPLVADNNVLWTTEKGYLYVAHANAEGIRYRLETRDAIHAQPAYWTPNIYAGSTDGFVYAVNEQAGTISWKFSIGDAIFASPVAIEGKVYVISEVSGMYCLDGTDGAELWRAPKIRQFVSASPKRIYAIDTLGRLAILNGQTGARLGSMALEGISLKLVNNESDRIYLASDHCVVQCFHEIELKKPVLYIPPQPEEKKATVKSPTAKPKQDKSVDDAFESEAASEDMPEMKDDAPPADDTSDENPFKEL